MFRELIFDTETTGLSPENGDRIIEIALLEVVEMKQTGRKFHCYLNPEGKRSNPHAFNKHRISFGFLRNKPFFWQIADDLLDFIGPDRLVAHNAAFDMRFLNMELRRSQRPAIPKSQSMCTQVMAKRVVNGSVNLDNLCGMFGIDRQTRDQAHSALLDCQLLYQVYQHLAQMTMEIDNQYIHVPTAVFERNGLDQQNQEGMLFLNKTSARCFVAHGPNRSFITRDFLERMNRENPPSRLQNYSGPDIKFSNYVVRVCGTVLVESVVFPSSSKFGRIRNHEFLVIDAPALYDCVLGVYTKK